MVMEIYLAQMVWPMLIFGQALMATPMLIQLTLLLWDQLVLQMHPG
jgi:hypothetical protein